jgi:hypothetical protein
MNTPIGLSKSELAALETCLADASTREPGELLAACRAHADKVETLADEDPIVDYLLAGDIADALEQVVAVWADLPDDAASWMKGCMYYFALVEDDEPDFETMVGFHDDARVLNACLRLIGRSDWCVEFDND